MAFHKFYFHDQKTKICFQNILLSHGFIFVMEEEVGLKCWKKYFYENYKCHTVKRGNHRDKLSFGTQIFSLPMKIDNPLLSRIDSKIFLKFVFRIHRRTILDIFLSLSSLTFRFYLTSNTTKIQIGRFP